MVREKIGWVWGEEGDGKEREIEGWGSRLMKEEGEMSERERKKCLCVWEGGGGGGGGRENLYMKCIYLCNMPRISTSYAICLSIECFHHSTYSLTTQIV